jgi:hypothetical protein
MKIKLISIILILCCFISVSGWADFWTFVKEGSLESSSSESIEAYKERCVRRQFLEE